MNKVQTLKRKQEKIYRSYGLINETNTIDGKKSLSRRLRTGPHGNGEILSIML